MTQSENLKIIALVGLSGAGKSTAVDYFTKKGYPKVYFGGVIYEAMAKAGITRTAESERSFREEFRAQYGKDVVVNRIIEQIKELHEAGQHRIIADGIYSWTEYKAMKRAFPGELTVVAVVASRHIRYHRLSKRPERPFTAVEAADRDWSEIENLEKGGPIAIADFFVINNSSIDELDIQLKTIQEQIEF